MSHLRLAAIFALLFPACSDYDLVRGKDEAEGGDDTGVPHEDEDFWWDDGECSEEEYLDQEVGLTDNCSFSTGGFNPIVEWDYASGSSSRAAVVVGDLDADGMPELVANVTVGLLPTGTGKLVALHGDGSGVLWEVPGAMLGYASTPALGDLDGDGWAEVVTVKEYSNSLLAAGEYSVVAYSAQGTFVWESEHFTGDDFDYASAVSISDMDHDGHPEVVVGRVILHWDGTTRGVGEFGRGSFGSVSFGGLTMDEGGVSVVVDLDLDGIEEVIVGNAMYSPDGATLAWDLTQDDGMVAVANLDSDPEGEYVVSSFNTVRAVDTDGTLLWGPREIPSANIVSVAAIGDVDGDGMPEILVAGGNQLLCINHDNTVLWTAAVTDETGATGAALFDFEGDGVPEVVYIDEVEMLAFDGSDGTVKFYTAEHSSDTMYDYPVIADVDADGHAEIIVAHAGAGAAFSVYGDENDSWAPARKVWNQHAYSVTNIYDNLSVPVTATPNFTTYNNFHAAIDRGAGEGLVDDLEGEIIDVCEADCDQGYLLVVGRVLNKSEREIPAGIPAALYGKVGTEWVLLDTAVTYQPIASGWSGEPMTFVVAAEDLEDVTSLRFVADDQGTGGGVISECSEDNNDGNLAGSFCE